MVQLAWGAGGHRAWSGCDRGVTDGVWGVDALTTVCYKGSVMVNLVVT